jgi:hypothetical protein
MKFDFSIIIGLVACLLTIGCIAYLGHLKDTDATQRQQKAFERCVKESTYTDGELCECAHRYNLPEYCY